MTVAVQDPRHPLHGRQARVVREFAARASFPASYEVMLTSGALLIVPVATTEPQDDLAARTKLSVPALEELIALIEGFADGLDRTEGPVGGPAARAAPPGARRSGRATGGAGP